MANDLCKHTTQSAVSFPIPEVRAAHTAYFQRGPVEGGQEQRPRGETDSSAK